MKKRAPSLLLALLALAGLLTAGGCSLGRSPRPDFYMLSSPVENVVQSGKEKISGPRVAIGPVSIPGYLDRPQLFLRDGNDVKVELAEFNHWSEPFGEGVTRALRRRVRILTPAKGWPLPCVRSSLSSGALPWISPVLTVRPTAASSSTQAGAREREREEPKSGRLCSTPPPVPTSPRWYRPRAPFSPSSARFLGR
ncbi:MAG: membrane integrity-associated transporter subunit PqiC [Bilophila wadsworthia]